MRIGAGLHRVARADGDGALDHDERGLLRGRRDSLGDGEHGAHVGRAVGTGRRADGDEVRVGLVEAGGDLGREAKPPGALVAANEIGQPRLVDRDDAVLELADPLGIDVHAEDVVPELGEAGSRDEPDVADAEGHQAHAGRMLGPRLEPTPAERSGIATTRRGERRARDRAARCGSEAAGRVRMST